MARNLHAEVTARIVAQLRAGVVPWRQPWNGKAPGAGMPRNAMTGRAYSGVNVLLLWSTAQERGYANPAWLTFKQALEAKGNVRKGEKGTTVVFVSTVERVDEETGKVKRIPFLKAYTVFNLAQCEGLDKLATAEPKVINRDERDATIDSFLKATGADIRHGEARAYFRPIGDYINLPAFESFKSSDAYYSVAAHELVHWTGAEARLNRTFGKRFGDAAYSVEELVAELGAAFICAEFGIDNEDQSAAYIASWIKFFESHETALVAAASASSKAVEFCRGLALESVSAPELEAAE